jgi:hypothetical protein
VDALHVEDLVAPLSRRQFLADHWDRSLPVVGRANQALVDAVTAIPPLANVQSLLPKINHKVLLFGPNGFRSAVAPPQALDFLNNGFNLYITGVERAVPEATALFGKFVQELGVAPWQVEFECFAGRAGQVSTRHYDHDVNFQILLAGEKRWLLEENIHIRNPLFAFHPRPGRSDGFREEAHVTQAGMPEAFHPERVQEIRVGPGTTVFLPRAYWHEVHSLSSTWSINLVIKGVTWGNAFAGALLNRMHRLPEFRAYCDHSPIGGESAVPSDERANHFARLRATARLMLAEIDYVEASLSQVVDLYTWTIDAEKRRLERRDGVAFLTFEGTTNEPVAVDDEMVAAVEQLMTFQNTFSWPDAQAVVHGVGIRELFHLLMLLIEAKALRKQHARPGGIFSQ